MQKNDKYRKWLADNKLTEKFLEQYNLQGTKDATTEQFEEFIAENYNKNSI